MTVAIIERSLEEGNPAPKPMPVLPGFHGGTGAKTTAGDHAVLSSHDPVPVFSKMLVDLFRPKTASCQFGLQNLQGRCLHPLAIKRDPIEEILCRRSLRLGEDFLKIETHRVLLVGVDPFQTPKPRSTPL
jgi:hypothetical protein